MTILKLIALWFVQNLEWFFLVMLLVIAYQIGYAGGVLDGVQMIDQVMTEVG